ncbi:FMN-dependent NADH-azoreductase [Sphingomonas sp. PAMC 26605]|uniref:FMN-dependent NADH-azoreductase n=1 Tax=Sphingomonas sp. PAMC 26605 TaxID=1112214 RepID=UPI00026CAD1D|nr:NAD(P)H-dependent oxidoreductase [Sphingomonas sp. PAMC 26605]
MNILHIDSSILGANSVTRDLGAALVGELRAASPEANVTYRDLAAEPITHLSGGDLALRGADEFNDEHLSEFLASNVLVIGAPMYNFGVPSTLKAWIDRIVVAGHTFSYSEQGPKGLAGGKTAFIVSGRGSAFEGNAAMAGLEHQESYLRGVLGFVGITDIRVVRAEGVGMGPEARDRAVAGARRDLVAIARPINKYNMEAAA